MLMAALSLAFIFADHKHQTFQPVRSTLSAVVAPIQYVVDAPVKLFDWFSSSLSSHKALLAENTNLKAQQLLLNAKLQKLIAIENENTQLRALLSSSSYAGDQVLVAQLLSVDSEPFVNQLVLDKGKKDGVYVGQPVLGAEGVMGQVIQVGPLTSRLMLITDNRSALPIQIARNGIRAIAVGQGSIGLLKLTHIPKTQDIKVGDKLNTSGMGQQFPYGYPVGEVVAVEHNAGEQFATIYAKPSEPINQRRQALLVWSDHLG